MPFERSYTQPLNFNEDTGTGQSAPWVPPIGRVIVTGAFGAKTASSTPISEDFSSYSENDTLVAGDWTQYQTNGGALIKTKNLPHRLNAKCATSNWARGQFATSYRYLPARTKKMFVSYWVSLIDNTAEDYGVYKAGRMTSSTRTLASGGGGGGGVYNGVGCMAYSNISPNALPVSGGQTSFTPVNTSNPSSNSGGTVLGNTPYHNVKTNGWTRIETYVDLGTADAANGRFYTRCGATSYQNYTGQTLSSSLRDFFMDTVLLGLDFANPKKWIGINGAVTANTNYTITISAVNYTVNSGISPTKTAVEIMEALYALLIVDYPTTGNGIFLNAAHTEILIGDPNSGIAHTFSSSLSYRAWGAAICDVLADYSREQFYLCPTPTFDHAVAEILRYENWTDGSSAELYRFGGQDFETGLNLFFIDISETPARLGEIVSNGAGGWEVTP